MNSDIDKQAWTYFERVIDQSVLLFQREPEYEKAIFGLSPQIHRFYYPIDELSSFFSNSS